MANKTGYTGALDASSAPILETFVDNGDGTFSRKGSGGGGAGDASAANQAIQITAEQAILAKIIAAPATEAKQDTQITAEQAILATLGATNGAAIITDADGTAQRYLRGLIKLWIAGLAAGEAHIGQIGGAIVVSSVEFTRPNDTTAYAANDVVSNNTTTTTLNTLPTCARVNGGSGYIVGARLLTDKKSITPRVRVHLFNVINPTVAADNAQHKSVYADASKRIASFDLSAMATAADSTNSDLSAATDWTLRIPFVCAGSDRAIYWFLETLDIFTPAANEKFTLMLLLDQN